MNTPSGRKIKPEASGDAIAFADYIKWSDWCGLQNMECLALHANGKRCAYAALKQERDIMLEHFASVHPKVLDELGLTEPAEPIKVKTRLVNERGDPLFLEG